MTRNGQTQREIEALGSLLDRYGADRTRWPAPDRLRFASVLKDSADARRLLAEAEVFDRLLDMAPTVDSARHATLAAGIVARATGDSAGRGEATAAEPAQRSGGAVTDLARARASRMPQPSRAPRFGGRSAWPAAALLAASLVLGIFAGSSGLLPTANFGGAAQTAESDFDGRVLALGPDIGAGADEDTL